MSKTTSQYILKSDSAERDRLDLQHRLYAKSSLELIKRAGLTKGMKVLEVGSGSGAMTLELAQLIGSQGSLLSIDLLPAQVAAAANLLDKHNNVHFQVADINELNKLGLTFDLIYCRMVLHHLDDARVAINQMSSCLNEQGLLVCEEPPILEGAFCFPKSRAHEILVNAVSLCFEKNKRDRHIAYRLSQEMRGCGLSIRHEGIFQPLLTTYEEKQLYPLALRALKAQMLEKGILTVTEINNLAVELTELTNEENSLSWTRMHQIIATKI